MGPTPDLLSPDLKFSQVPSVRVEAGELGSRAVLPKLGVLPHPELRKRRFLCRL